MGFSPLKIYNELKSARGLKQFTALSAEEFDKKYKGDTYKAFVDAVYSDMYKGREYDEVNASVLREDGKVYVGDLKRTQGKVEELTVAHAEPVNTAKKSAEWGNSGWNKEERDESSVWGNNTSFAFGDD